MYYDFANVLIFLLFGGFFVILNVSILSRFLRPTVKDAAKETTYECGEPPVGSGWVRFDFRFYTVALIFLIFDVEVAFLYPWAIVFQEVKRGAAASAEPWVLPGMLFIEMLVFLGLLVVGFIYVWAKGDLSWIKALDRTRAGGAEMSGREPEIRG